MPLLRPHLPRLPVQHVYRAFRELDTYADEQCRRFVQAAKGSIRRRLFGLALIVLVTLIGASGGIAGFSYIQGCFLDPHRTLNIGHPLVTWYGWLLNIALGITGFVIGPVLGYLTRDFLLIRRIRHILRTRGTCISCRYTLVGLFVAPDLSVTCPECGTTTTVDPALGELVTDEAGRPRFRPDESRHKARRFFTEARIKRLKRAAPWIAAAIVGGPLILAGSYEIFLRWQAGVAQRERPASDSLVQLIEANRLPGEKRGEPDAWIITERAAEQMAALDLQIWNSPGTKWNPNDERRYPDYTAIFHPYDYDDEHLYDEAHLAARSAHDEQCRLLALEMIDLHRKSGLYDTLRVAADTRSFTRDFWSDAYTTLEETLPVANLGPRRMLINLSAARLHLAFRAGDKAEYLDALRSGLALAALQLRQPGMIDYLTGLAMEATIIARLFDHLIDGVPPDWLLDIDTLLAEHEIYASCTTWIEGERLTALDTVAFAFSHPSNVRWGRWSPAVALYRDRGGRLGTYSQNRDAILVWHAHMLATRNLTVEQRAASPGTEHDLMLVNASLLPSRTSLTTDTRSTLSRRAVRTIIAIDRYRALHGAPPDSLAALVPDFLPEAPIDPWIGKPLGYNRIDPTTDPLNRPYLLYCVGGDFTDNGGATDHDLANKVQIFLPGRPEGIGLDFILNSSDW